MTKPLLQVAYHSERGRRENNEDMYGLPHRLARRPLDERGYAIHPMSGVMYTKKGYLFLLADGVGGAQGGELASRIIVEEVANRYYRDPSTDAMTSLQRVIEAANRQLRRWREQSDGWRRMATTLVAAVIHPQEIEEGESRIELLIAGVGDSRVYLIRPGESLPLTSDHSWLQQQLQWGRLTEVEAASSPHKNRITRSLGSHDQVGVDTWQVELAAGDRVLLCSDGLSNFLDEGTLTHLAYQPDLQRAVNGLIDTAYDNGSADNLSAVLISLS